MFFSKRVIIRLSETQIKDIELIKNERKDIYESKSHFIRCAIIRLIKLEMIELRKRS
jgi:hypothetical protein